MMTKYIDSTYSGYCPKSLSTRTIGIRFAEVSFINQSSNEYKKMIFDCPDVEVCQHLDEYGRCPLFVEAPNHP